VTKAAIFSTKAYDQDFLDIANVNNIHRLTYFEPRQSIDTGAPEDRSNSGVCICE